MTQLTRYLRTTTTRVKELGDIEGLLLTGLTPDGIDLLQGYVDSTGDVQSAAIFSSFVSPSRFEDIRVKKWVEAYHELLDNWKLFHYRCQFSITRGQIFQELINDGRTAPFEWAERQLLIRCNYCNKVVNSLRPLEAGRPTAMSASGDERVRVSILKLSRPRKVARR